MYGIVQKKLLDLYSPLMVCAWGYSLGTLEIALTIALFVPIKYAWPSIPFIPQVCCVYAVCMCAACMYAAHMLFMPYACCVRAACMHSPSR